MKYYSEDIVREMVKEAEDIAYARSLGVKTEPLNIEDYPSIEIPDEHGRLIDANQLQEVLNLALSLVITNKLTDMEIELVHRTIGAMSDAVNDMDTILEASK